MASNGHLELRANYGAPSDAGKIEVDDDFFETEAYRDGHAVAVTVANGRSPLHLPAYDGVTSYAVAPIVRDDKSVGILVGAYCGGRREVDAGDVQLLQIFAFNVRSALDATPPADAPPWSLP